MRITRTYLQQLGPTDLIPAQPPAEPLEVTLAQRPSPEFARFLYTAVGGDWYWTDRLDWSRQRWREWLAQPGLETWVGWLRGSPAGYVQLLGRPEGDGTDVEVVYLGLLPDYVGHGYGGQLLTVGLRRAWSLAGRHPGLPPVRRVWLHTCTLDGPGALPNYRARGLEPYHVEEYERPVADEPPGPWPGAHDPR